MGRKMGGELKLSSTRTGAEHGLPLVVGPLIRIRHLVGRRR